MSEEELEMLELTINADKVFDVNFHNVSKELLKSYKDLQQENKRLQKQLDFIIERNDEKQQRIDKAIEILKGSAMFYCEEDRQWLEELFKRILEILGDKENE